MVRFASIIFVCFLNFFAVGQERQFTVTDSIMGSFSYFSVDNFGRVYLCKEDVILQYYQKKQTYSTSLKAMRPSVLESSKSFRTLVFDQERSIVRFYDNTLTDIHGEIDLVINAIQQPVLVCESFSGNSFWVLDGGMMRLIKLDQDLKVVSQTENLVSVFDNDNLPTQMLEYNDYLYVLIPEKGVAIFDVFGTFIKIYPVDALTMGALNNYLLLYKDSQIIAVANDAFFSEDFIYDAPENVKQFVFMNEKVYFLLEDRLLIGEYIANPDKE